MSASNMERNPTFPSNTSHFLANVAIQIGCFTFGVVILALLLGLWLDRIFEIKGIFTISLILASIPLTWTFIFWSINRAKRIIKQSQPSSSSVVNIQAEEEDHDNS